MSENLSAEPSFESQVRDVEEQPLADRAPGYLALQEDLVARLDAGIAGAAEQVAQ